MFFRRKPPTFCFISVVTWVKWTRRRPPLLPKCPRATEQPQKSTGKLVSLFKYSRHPKTRHPKTSENWNLSVHLVDIHHTLTTNRVFSSRRVNNWKKIPFEDMHLRFSTWKPNFKSNDEFIYKTRLKYVNEKLCCFKSQETEKWGNL